MAWIFPDCVNQAFDVLSHTGKTAKDDRSQIIGLVIMQKLERIGPNNMCMPFWNVCIIKSVQNVEMWWQCGKVRVVRKQTCQNLL